MIVFHPIDDEDSLHAPLLTTRSKNNSRPVYLSYYWAGALSYVPYVEVHPDRDMVYMRSSHDEISISRVSPQRLFGKAQPSNKKSTIATTPRKSVCVVDHRRHDTVSTQPRRSVGTPIHIYRLASDVDQGHGFGTLLEARVMLMSMGFTLTGPQELYADVHHAQGYM